MQNKISSILLFSLFVLVAGVARVYAQEATESGDVLPTPALLTVPKSTSEEKLDLYREQITAYRTSEDVFRVNKQQYFNLNTLASLEKAVTSTRDTLLARSKVLVTYLELIEERLTATQGIDLDKKEKALADIESQLTILLEHQDAILLSTDRDALLAVTTSFYSNRELLDHTIYQGLTLIAIGNIQTVNDKAEALLEDIKIEHGKEKVSALVTAKRERAYTETTKHIEDTNTDIRAVLLQQFKKEDKLFTKANYSQIIDALDVPYITATKTLGFLQELLTQ